MKHIRGLALVACAALLSGCESIDAAMITELLGGKELGNDTIVAGLKEALQVGTDRSVETLSRSGGYADDPLLRLTVPDELEKFASTLRAVGLGGEIDAFERKMNAAAESAAAQAAPVFLDAITSMTFDDARKILDGNKTAATSFFRRKTKAQLTSLYAPVVRSHMSEVGAVQVYDDLRSSYDAIPLVPELDFSLESYVTDKALDGLFLELGKVEKDIRTNPGARITELLQKVFAGQR